MPHTFAQEEKEETGEINGNSHTLAGFEANTAGEAAELGNIEILNKFLFSYDYMEISFTNILGTIQYHSLSKSPLEQRFYTIFYFTHHIWQI